MTSSCEDILAWHNQCNGWVLSDYESLIYFQSYHFQRIQQHESSSYLLIVLEVILLMNTSETSNYLNGRLQQGLGSINKIF